MFNHNSTKSKTPLELQKAKVLNKITDKLESISVLERKLCKTKIPKTSYIAIPKKISDYDLPEYESMVDRIIASLQWVLSLSHAKFWCQALHDQGLHKVLDAYLKQSPRVKMSNWPSNFQTKHDQLHKLVFMTLLRMSTPKESEENFITPSIFGELIYSNYLFDVPRVLDMCSCFATAPQNKPLLSKMISCIFKNQENYFADWKEAMSIIIGVLAEVEAKVLDGNTTISCLNKNKNNDLSETELCDVLLYMSDIFCSLKLFAQVFPDGCSTFLEEGGFVEKLPDFYSLLCRNVAKSIKNTQFSTEEIEEEMKCMLHKCIVDVVDLTVTIVNSGLLNPLETSSGENDQHLIEHYANNYFQTLQLIQGNAAFVERLKKHGEFVSGVQKVLDIYPPISRQPHVVKLTQVFKAPIKEKTKVKRKKENLKKVKNTDSEPSKEELADIKLSEAVSIVLDLFPDMDVGYVQRCLKYFDLDADKFTAAKLDDNLPVHLLDVPTSEQSSSNTDKPGSSGISLNQNPGASGTSLNQKPSFSDIQEEDLLSRRRNIFDGDEFDVFNNSSKIDLSKIKRGKDTVVPTKAAHWKEKVGKNASQEVARITRLYDTYHSTDSEEDFEEEEVIPLNPNYQCDYNDERDDYNDEFEVGVNEGDQNNQSSGRFNNNQSGSRYNTNSQSRGGYKNNNQSRGEYNNNNQSRGGYNNNNQSGSRYNNQSGSRDTTKDFVRNPEDVRREKEQKWKQQQEMNAYKHKRNNKKQQNKKEAPKSKEDQQAESKKKQLIERKKTNENKSRVANHNRKRGATRKMASAMR